MTSLDVLPAFDDGEVTVVKEQQREQDRHPPLLYSPVSHGELPQRVCKHALRKETFAHASHILKLKAPLSQKSVVVLTVTMKVSTTKTKRNQISTWEKVGLYVFHWDEQ